MHKTIKIRPSDYADYADFANIEIKALEHFKMHKPQFKRSYKFTVKDVSLINLGKIAEDLSFDNPVIIIRGHKTYVLVSSKLAEKAQVCEMTFPSLRYTKNRKYAYIVAGCKTDEDIIEIIKWAKKVKYASWPNPVTCRVRIPKI